MGFSYEECEMNRTRYAAIALLFLVLAGLFSISAVTGREKTAPLAEAAAGFVGAVVCLVMAFKKESARGDRSPTSEEPTWVSWFIWGGILGLVVGVVGGASAGASLVGRWGASGVLASIGAVLGAVIGAPVGVVLGWIVSAIVVEIIVPLLCTIPLLIALVLKRLWETRR
jgi:hypothetical protein